jgi:hypothetical protein
MRCLRIGIILGIAISLLGPWAASAATQDIAIFKGDDPTQDGISLGGWGSGGAAKTKEQILDGGWSIKISTQGLYAGGKIEFTQPVTLFSGTIDPTRYVQFAIFFRETQVINPAAGTDYGWSDVEPYTKPKAGKVRFVFVSDSGQTIEAVEPTAAIDPDDNWMRVAVPLAKFKSIAGITEFRMKQLLIFTDIPSTIYLGSMKLATDTTPIKVDPLDPRTIAIMDQQFFVATATGGVSSLKYSWDFDSSNGLQADSSDRIAKYVYKTGGEYTVTLTVGDADGLKEPVTVSTVVSVSD